MEALLERLRSIDPLRQADRLKLESSRAVLTEFARSGVKFAASSGTLENAYYSAVYKLPDCVSREPDGSLALQEGGVYKGCWLESTGTINAEVLSRFVPSVSQATLEQFADLQREDGLLPYKIVEGRPVFRQIQLVSPPARSVWNHYLLNGKERNFLGKMYAALSRYDEWLEKFRDTRGTGCVEAFCAFDTGHDLSPRFWHVADTPHRGDPARVDPDSPLVPFLAPDLTASVYCSRKYLARMAEELGVSASWDDRAEASVRALFEHCYDERDGFFYDRDKHGRFVRVQSDSLLRVLACEVGDAELFAASLSRYLLNTRKFFAKYPFTSIAMDDPRFDPHSTYNSWSGATNFLSLIRAPRAFEHHGRHVELTWTMQPILSALSRMTKFGQVLSPWTGEEGYTESYSPAILCMLDYVERLCGILPTPEGELWFTGLLPYPMDHGAKLAEQTAYARAVDGTAYELLNSAEECAILADGRELARFPYGVRVVTDRNGRLQAIVGMTARPIEGPIQWKGKELPFRIDGNERLAYRDGEDFFSAFRPGIVWPGHD
ncbi:hypothetical protein ACF3MZ_00470 [Paenibacillaceae bacterium WGS1546]|uniref:MGH1-like glycoside hydrolase domain-containing protein n=1 Tax=Cohnella sp. WGS1546 TaxID=3366810 RepID=UPI00372D7469